MEDLVLEMGLVLGLAFICIILFIVYIARAKVEVRLHFDFLMVCGFHLRVNLNLVEIKLNKALCCDVQAIYLLHSRM